MTATALPDWHSNFAAAADVTTETVHARGVLDLFTVDLLCGAIDVVVLSGRTHVIIDLGDVTRIDRAAVRALVEQSVRLRQRKVTYAFCRATPDVAADLEAGGL